MFYGLCHPDFILFVDDEGLIEPLMMRKVLEKGASCPLIYLILLWRTFKESWIKFLSILNSYSTQAQKAKCVHICFANDLLVFCKVDITSIMLCEAAFVKFSSVSVLQANIGKILIYVSRVKSELKKTVFCDSLKETYLLNIWVSNCPPKSLSLVSVRLLWKNHWYIKYWSAKHSSMMLGGNWLNIFYLSNLLGWRVSSP